MCQSWAPTNGNHANRSQFIGDIDQWYFYYKLDLDFSKCVARKELNYMRERERDCENNIIREYQILQCEYSIKNQLAMVADAQDGEKFYVVKITLFESTKYYDVSIQSKINWQWVQMLKMIFYTFSQGDIEI